MGNSSFIVGFVSVQSLVFYSEIQKLNKVKVIKNYKFKNVNEGMKSIKKAKQKSL
ncbi:hypothetical protein P872_17250 [Rhodonellum psychrophilum GCM71 = DSM 17998]|uniref:Uncharacterized protein n=1 Tax=Rhodonellum psychrophilum GCM71 = DSM 17998 TaxID=1123057 RepID=U5BZU7_9BACT|nr:hypothetical protein P872_17250 [Rhodonellum psychrophilum GCM71 = DSM 17998]